MDLDIVELKDLLSPSLQERMNYYQWVENSYPKIIDNAGKQELIGLRLISAHVEEVSLMSWQKIIKLTWQHFLGIENQTCQLFLYEYQELRLLAVFKVDGKITLNKVMN